MFTGLIKGLGEVRDRRLTAQAASLKVKTPLAQELGLGDSIAVNGVCLTAAKLGNDWFQADIMPETWQASNLAMLNPGALVNLEPALVLGSSLGGHLVSGHVDGLGKISGIKTEKNAILVRVKVSTELAKQMILKGSVAVNGISLTIQELTDREFVVSLIPHTIGETTFKRSKIGELVNIETDILAKYALNELNNASQGVRNPEKKITAAFLAEHGFLK